MPWETRLRVRIHRDSFETWLSLIADVSVVDTDDRPKKLGSVAVDLPATNLGHTLQGARLAVAPERRLWPTRGIIVVLALVLVFSILSVWLFHSRRSASTGIRSIAVFPLENLSGDASQNYFADGMTDELITHLAQNSALRVISRTSVMACIRSAQTSATDRS